MLLSYTFAGMLCFNFILCVCVLHNRGFARSFEGSHVGQWRIQREGSGGGNPPMDVE
jgi:hypothetical protein